MPFYEKGDVRIYFEDTGGSGFPLLIIPGGGLNSTISWNTTGAPFNPVKELGDEYRCIMADLRNAPSGQSSGPLDVERPWDAHTDDQLGVMDHLGIKQFMALGFCIGGPFIWNLLKRAPDRVIAAVLSQPSGVRAEKPTLSFENNMKGWGPNLIKKRPDVTMDTVERFLSRMYHGTEFVYTVSRDFVRACQTPVLIMPDDIPGHPYAVAMESARLAPKSQVTLYPWQEPKEHVAIAVRHVRTFLREHKPKQAASA